MNASYMEMVIKDDDLRGLKMVYKLHKQGISREHPQFGFRKPMRLAAEYGRLDMLKWLGEQEERGEWLEDRWLLDAAIKSCSLDVVQWVHSVYTGKDQFVLLCKPLDLVAPQGALELLQWVLATFPKAQLTTNAMDGAAANGHLEMVKYLHSEWKEGYVSAESLEYAKEEDLLEMIQLFEQYNVDGWTTILMDHAAAVGCLESVRYLHSHRTEGCTTRAMDEAAKGGHLDVVKFLHENRSEGSLLKYFSNFVDAIPVDLIEEAVCNGHWYITKFLLSTTDQLDAMSDRSFSKTVEIASLYGDIDMVELLLSANYRFKPSNAHGFINTSILGNIDLLELLEKARQQGGDLWERLIYDGMDTEPFAGTKMKWRSVQLAVTAYYGHVELAHWLYDRRYGHFKSAHLAQCAASDEVDMARTILSFEPSAQVTNDAIAAAAKRGNVRLFKLLYQFWEVKESRRPLIDYAAGGGSYDLVKFIHENCPKAVCTWRAIDLAVRSDQLDIVRYLHEKRTEGCSVNAMGIDACKDYLTTLQFLHTHRHEGCTTAAMDWAAAHGNLSVVKFLHENRSEGCTSAAMDEAAEREYFHVVQYLHTNRTEGCTTSAMDSVARHGSFRVLNWLNENRDEGCSTKAMDGAALTSQLTIMRPGMVKFLHKNRQEGYHETVLDKAVQLDPEDESLVQQYLRPVELKDNYASSLFTSA
ncbi:hypothetical protein Poli38472_013680 [Pythium oligandrum]|uniref:Ankyrin repeat-containing domain n=1 Tax=Pythium oligandrum TaxID=41045 RepID=A0A8K1FIY0_PYTOL|nr:hypothetical protein Poli38472_013680 [Pythium oligandrum]|eukprot:TMW61217.1 hypothetical protein Poli38472_013680 [Pythium oligandrum]